MLMRSITTWIFEQEEPLQVAEKYADLEGTALFYSGQVNSLDVAANSYLSLFPEKKIEVKGVKGSWEELQQKLIGFEKNAPFLPKYVGFLSYEMGAVADEEWEVPLFSTTTPAALFYHPTAIIHFDHKRRLATLYATEEGYDRYLIHRSVGERHTEVSWKLKRVSDTRATFSDKIAQAKEWIRHGEIYQVNLSHAMEFEGHLCPFTLFRRMTSLNPVPFSLYMNCGSFHIVSASPERFLSKQGGRLETRPIKGTYPRGKDSAQDRSQREKLIHSEKERAELLMICDLMRSDLSKISRPGSVVVKKLWHCEAFANVFHLLSVVEGEAVQECHPLTLLKPLFPGGSITGCPKLRAMEAISALEKRGRGIYTGSIGYFAANGDFDFNIAIRTLIVYPTYVHLQLGSGIVLDSDPLLEFEETLHKGRCFFRILT